MKSYKTHIQTKFLFLFLPLLLLSCEKPEEKPEVYVAEVGNEKLSINELDRQVGNSNSPKFREEIINRWIENEVLAQVSEQSDFLNDENYNKIIYYTGRELAASIAIQKYLSSNPVKYSNNDLRDFFIENRTDFSFIQDAYFLNYIAFNSEEGAIKFRNRAIKNGWTEAVNEVETNPDLIDSEKNRIFKINEIQSKRIIRVITKLQKNEISLVIRTELNHFVVVQHIDLIKKNSVPNFNYIKGNVEKSYIALQQKKQIKSYIDSLINNMNVKIY